MNPDRSFPLVVLLVGAPVEPSRVLAPSLGDSSLRESISEALGRPAHIVLLSWLAPAVPADDFDQTVTLSVRPQPLVDRMLDASPAHALSQRLSRSPIGRLINSLNIADQSRIFLRAVRHDKECSGLLDRAEVIIASDLPSARTAWEAARRNPRLRAFYGIAGALAKLTESQKSTHPEQ